MPGSSSRGSAVSGGHRYRYRALPEFENDMADNNDFKPHTVAEEDISAISNTSSSRQRKDSGLWSRQRYPGALLFNIFTFILPALYGTLSKLWIAGINKKMVVTTDTYTYIGVVTEVINEGLPRASYVIIGDRSSRSITSRISLSNTLIIAQACLGGIMSVVIAAAAKSFAGAFVPIEVREESVTYVRISAFSTLFGAVEVAVGAATRALDRPDVPLLISSVKTALNIILDVLLISKFRVGHLDVDVNTQAIIRLSCDAAGALAGVLFFTYLTNIISLSRPSEEELQSRKPSRVALWTLVRQGRYTFIESAIRNILYLWLVSGIVKMGSDYTTAWGVFNTIRWGLIMVPVQALEATALTFVGHAWGFWRFRVGIDNRTPKASWKDLLMITRPALTSTVVALAVEIPICITFSVWGARPFAYWLSESDSVADITAYMWKTIDWCYIFYAISTQLAAILVATRPRWYLAQSFCSNIFWVLPWAIAVTRIKNFNKETAWKWHSIVFGGSLVVSFVIILAILAAWSYRLTRGLSRLSSLSSATFYH